MGFSRQEYWNGLPRPPPGDLSNPGIERISLTSPALAGISLQLALPGKLLQGREACKFQDIQALLFQVWSTDINCEGTAEVSWTLSSEGLSPKPWPVPSLAVWPWVNH